MNAHKKNSLQDMPMRSRHAYSTLHTVHHAYRHFFNVFIFFLQDHHDLTA